MSQVTLQVLSDLHFEYGFPKSLELISTFNSEGVDVLVLAGDICSGSQIEQTMRAFRAHYPNADIVYVPGNHEYWRVPADDVHAAMDRAYLADMKLHILNNEVVTVRGVTFAGGTMWFPRLPGNEGYEMRMPDFRVIQPPGGQEPRDWFDEEHDEFQQAVRFAAEGAAENGHPLVVVSHHMPHPICIHAKYEGRPSNRFFLADQRVLIAETRPRLWIHGHTHEHVDAAAGDGSPTRIVANPRGYGHHDEPDWKGEGCEFEPDFRIVLQL